MIDPSIKPSINPIKEETQNLKEKIKGIKNKKLGNFEGREIVYMKDYLNYAAKGNVGRFFASIGMWLQGKGALQIDDFEKLVTTDNLVALKNDLIDANPKATASKTSIFSGLSSEFPDETPVSTEQAGDSKAISYSKKTEKKEELLKKNEKQVKKAQKIISIISDILQTRNIQGEQSKPAGISDSEPSLKESFLKETNLIKNASISDLEECECIKNLFSEYIDFARDYKDEDYNIQYVSSLIKMYENENSKAYDILINAQSHKNIILDNFINYVLSKNRDALNSVEFKKDISLLSDKYEKKFLNYVIQFQDKKIIEIKKEYGKEFSNFIHNFKNNIGLGNKYFFKNFPSLNTSIEPSGYDKVKKFAPFFQSEGKQKDLTKSEENLIKDLFAEHLIMNNVELKVTEPQ